MAIPKTVTDKLPISVCLITGAEAHRIRRALESVASWAAEIIVVLNDDATDGTDTIAASYGAKVFREPWKGHIAQKNSALAKATQVWVLGLDADEEISPTLQAEIRTTVQASQNPHNAWCFPRCTQYAGKWIRHGDWYPDRQTRLWRRGTAKWGGMDPHDHLQVEGTVGRLHGDLMHYSMESFDHQLRKFMRYADDFARECAARNIRVGLADIVFRPGWRFFRGYVLKLGFLDGWQGYVIARMTAFYTLLRYLKAREAQNRPPAP